MLVINFDQTEDPPTSNREQSAVVTVDVQSA